MMNFCNNFNGINKFNTFLFSYKANSVATITRTKTFKYLLRRRNNKTWCFFRYKRGEAFVISTFFFYWLVLESWIFKSSNYRCTCRFFYRYLHSSITFYIASVHRNRQLYSIWFVWYFKLKTLCIIWYRFFKSTSSCFLLEYDV